MAEPGVGPEDGTTWTDGPSTPGEALVVRMLDHHDVAALIWCDGVVRWANQAAVDLVSTGNDRGTGPLAVLGRTLGADTPLGELVPGEERRVELHVPTSSALLTVSALAVRREDTEVTEVLVTFRAPLGGGLDPDRVARLEAMVDAASDIITVIDQQGRIRFSNPAAGDVTGISGAAANGTSMLEFVHPEDRAATLDAFDIAVRRGGRIDPLLVRVRMADGAWHHLEATVAGAVALDDGTVGRVVALRDVSDRVRRDAELDAHRRRLESLVENIDDVIVILSPELTVTWASPGIERLVDAPAATNLGEHALNDMHPDDVDGVLAALRDALAEPDGRARATLRLRHQRFGWRWVEAAAVNRLDDPAVGGLVCTLRDITDQRDEAGELARLRARDREELSRLRDADRAKDRFLATVSHELRTPLTAVRGFGSVLRQQWDDLTPASREQLLDRVIANAATMEAMIEQLLDFSRLQAGRVAVRIEPLALDDLVGDMIEALAHHLQHHEVVVETRGLWVLADQAAFGHVLRNLLTNAVKYSEAGTRIDIDAEADDDVVRLHVRDRGIGIAPEDHRRVFQSFFQSGPPVRDQRGTGVGLNVARRYAQLQSGRLDLVSEPGAGSTFTLTLPAAAP